VFCPAKRPENKDDGLYFLIRTTKRQVPVVRVDKEPVRGKPPVVSWQEQQELLLLPTIRIFNLFTSNISAKLLALAPGNILKHPLVVALEHLYVSCITDENHYELQVGLVVKLAVNCIPKLKSL
jgi:hypothetical protein